MRKVMHIIVCLLLLSVSACDVHEWPEAPETVPFHLRLNYETMITEWNHIYDGSEVIEQGYGKTYDNHLRNGLIRYVIRVYPLSEKRRAVENHIEELVFTRNISDGYDHGVTLDLPAGSYSIMVWSDLVRSSEESHFYDASDFGEIRLQGDHIGNTDYKDAFRGIGGIDLVSDIVEHDPDTLDITMQRPLAKFEFITNDVLEFIDNEITRIASKTNGNKSESADDIPTKAINIEDYKVVFYYVGFMPDAYSMYTDKPVDSSTEVMFESTLKKITESEATIGFDYVFVNGKESALSAQIAIFDNEGTQLSLTEPIEVPLKRSHHTIMKGRLLMSDASGGVTINPDFDGDHNLIFP